MKRFVRTITPDAYGAVAVDHVDRCFQAPGPDRLWVADITYIPTWSGFLYLSMVLDVWSRKIVGWAMESHLRTELVLAATTWHLRNADPRTSSTTAIESVSTPVTPSENAARRWA